MGRTSLAIGVVFLAIMVVAGDLVANAMKGQRDWWPIRREARLYDRLSAMPVRITYKDDTNAEAWRWDWPALRSDKQGIPHAPGRGTSLSDPKA